MRLTREQLVTLRMALVAKRKLVLTQLETYEPYSGKEKDLLLRMSDEFNHVAEIHQIIEDEIKIIDAAARPFK